MNNKPSLSARYKLCFKWQFRVKSFTHAVLGGSWSDFVYDLKESIMHIIEGIWGLLVILFAPLRLIRWFVSPFLTPLSPMINADAWKRLQEFYDKRKL